MKRYVAMIALLFLQWLGLCTGPIHAQQREVSDVKRTTLGLYLTAQEAYEKWKADPEHVKTIDVRAPEEYILVGHPEMAWNVPLKFLSYQWDEASGKPVMWPNPGFVAQVKRIVKPGDTVLVICRSGHRGAPAVNLLAELGFTDVCHIIDGVEGDTVEDPENVSLGKRMKNGWKNSGLPWTYDLDREHMCIEQSP